MLRIYHVTGTRGIRPIWLCEELGIEYTLTPVDFSPEYRASPEWRAISPGGKVPVMIDGGLTMLESGAMVQYLLGRYGGGRLAPAPDSAGYGPYLQWCWYAEATLARPIGEVVNHGRAFPGEARLPSVVEEMAARTGLCLQVVAAHMRGREYLVDDEFSAADIMMGYSLMLAQRFTPEHWPDGLSDYWARLDARPAFAVARAA